MQKDCIVIPCYNEEHRIQSPEYEKFLNEYPKYDLLFVNDGSLDNTLEKLNDFQTLHRERVFILNKKVNTGKGEAIREGLLHGLTLPVEYNYFAFNDADLATPLTEIHNLFSISKKYYSIIVFGSRVRTLNSMIKRNICRHYLGRFFATIVHVLFKLEIYDTQCGAKVIHRAYILKIFNKPFITKWLFDIEIFLRLKKMGIFTIENIESKKILEVPLSKWRDMKRSKITIFDFIKIPIDIIKIRMAKKLR